MPPKDFFPVRDQIGTPLLIVMSMVSLVFLIASANVASLLMLRAAGRVREMSVRYAMGASRIRVVQQLVIEGLVLGLAGGTCSRSRSDSAADTENLYPLNHSNPVLCDS